MRLGLEKLLRVGFNVQPSPLQRAICLAAEGRPIGEDVLDDAGIEAHFGCPRSRIGLVAPVLLTLICGIRSGKSMFACCGTLRCVFSADLSGLLPGERARGVIVAPLQDNALATFRLLRALIDNTPSLAGCVVGEPTADTIVIRRPDGRLVEIVVVAAHRGGIALRSRWLTSVVLDEAALFGAVDAGSVVNAEELERAGVTRLVPGGQAWVITSPYGKVGYVYALYRDLFGKPGRELVVHASTLAMNPAFPLGKIEEIRRRDPDGAAREYDALWLDGSISYFDGATVARCTRATPLVVAPIVGWRYTAAIDPASRSNGFTLVVSAPVRRAPDGLIKHRIVLTHEWRGSKSAPLDLDAVFADMARLLQPYGMPQVVSDQHSYDALKVIAALHGIRLAEAPTTSANRTGMYENLKTLFANEQIEIPADPRLLADLAGVQRRATQGGISIVLPTTADGRHCDFVPALALSVIRGGAHLSAESAFQTKLQRLGKQLYKQEHGGRRFADDYPDSTIEMYEPAIA